MDPAQGATSTGEAVETTQTQQEPKAETLSPLQAAVRKELNVEGHRPEEEPRKEPEGAGDTPATTEEPAPEPEEPEQAGDTPAATEEPEADPQVPGDWPQTAKARVAEEARKRRERTLERDQWKAEAEKLAGTTPASYRGPATTYQSTNRSGGQAEPDCR